MSAPAVIMSNQGRGRFDASPVIGVPGLTMTPDVARNPGMAGYSRFDWQACPPKGQGGGMNDPQARLDQGEAWTFLRQLEDIDKTAYMQRFPALKARLIIPTIINVAAWARVHTWRGWTPVGAAKVIGNAADDLPMADLTGVENSQVIKLLGGAYGFDMMELKYAAATGTPIDQMRAVTARQAMEQLIDTILATGSADSGLYGLLNLDSTNIASGNRVTVYTLSTKAAGGTKWGTLAAPVATGQEVANDLIGIASDIVNQSKGIWQKVTIALSINGYNYAAGTRINAVNDTTALQFALKSDFIDEIVPWYQCAGAAANGTDDRMVAFPKDPTVLGGIVPMDWTPQPVQQKNLAFVVPCIASCGGVIVRYPIACRYADSY